jgi:hypothetical protein
MAMTPAEKQKAYRERKATMSMRGGYEVKFAGEGDPIRTIQNVWSETATGPILDLIEELHSARAINTTARIRLKEEVAKLGGGSDT